MEVLKINTELLSILLFLAPGYLGFRLYQIDQPWRKLNTIDVIYGSLIFSTLAYGTYLLLLSIGWADSPARRVGSLLLFSFLYALIWRRFGHAPFHKALHWLGITNEDNSSTAWSQIFNNPKIYLSQIIIHLKDGSQVQCDHTHFYHLDDLKRVGVHPYYSDAAGNLYLVCTHRRATPDAEWEEIPDIHCPAPWGIKLSFVPTGEIVRIEARATESGLVSAV